MLSFCINYNVSKKQDTKLLPTTFQNVNWFSNIYILSLEMGSPENRQCAYTDTRLTLHLQ